MELKTGECCHRERPGEGELMSREKLDYSSTLG
jgi:hypothetical protein